MNEPNIFHLVLGLILLALIVLGVLAPYFIFRINQKCSQQVSIAKEQVELLKKNIEAQNQVITILWDIKNNS